MKIETIIRNKRSLEYAVEKNKDEDAKRLLSELINEYYNSLEINENEIYYDCGYYRYHNMDLCVSSKEKAEFRVLKSNKKQIVLLKNNSYNWDETVLDKKINIVSPFEQYEEEIPMYILQQYIEKLIYSFTNYEQHECEHIEFIDNGYYKYEEEKIKNSDRQEADFRIVTCKTCKKQYLLPKRESKYWDVTLGKNAITVFNKKEQIQKTFCQ